MIKSRLLSQIIALLAANPLLNNYISGRIYQGKLKGICVPFLNCYSCPGAVGSCPLGALQNGLAMPGFKLPLYVIGFLLTVGAVAGRTVCGWLCPFGFIQELFGRITKYKIKLPFWTNRIKYLVLALTMLLPFVVSITAGFGAPYFCSYVCPAGLLMAGLPLLVTNPSYLDLAGSLFVIKVTVLLLIIIMSVISWRPFCRVLCPLGAFWGFFNRIAIVRLYCDRDTCTSCNRCTPACPAGLKLPENINSPECIRCLSCRDACRVGSINWLSGDKVWETKGRFTETETGRQHDPKKIH